MGLFNFGKTKGESPQELAQRARLAEADAIQKGTQLEALQELVRHLDGDRLLLLRAAEELRPGLEPKALGEVLLDICFKPPWWIGRRTPSSSPSITKVEGSGTSRCGPSRSRAASRARP